MELIHKSKRSLEFEDVVGKYCRQSGISTIYLDDISKMKWIPFTKSSANWRMTTWDRWMCSQSVKISQAENFQLEIF